MSRTRPDLSLPFEPSEAWPSSSRSSTPSSFASQEEGEADLEPETPGTACTPSEAGRRSRVLTESPGDTGFAKMSNLGLNRT